ncbi:Protein F41C3.2 [Aphelenchoides avenae]|nr:Protein F41C3.2 [Aphelenchus avenae]
MSFPSLGSVTSAWSTLKEQGFYLAIISSHLQLAEILTMPIAGELCKSEWGWPSVFYSQGAITGFLFIIFFFIYRDSPKKCWYVSSAELEMIEEGKATGTSAKRQAVPYLPMFKDTAVWACFLAGMAAAASFNIFAQYGPIYLNKILHFDIEGTGFLIAIPFALSIGAKMISGPLCDRLACLSVHTRVVKFTFVALLVNFICFVVLGLFPNASSTLALVLITCVIASNGLGFVGLARNAQAIAINHSHFIMAVISLINCFAVLLLPTFVSTVAPDYQNSAHQWSLIFYINAGVIIATNVLFLIFAKTESRAWARQPRLSQTFILSSTLDPSEPKQNPLV